MTGASEGPQTDVVEAVSKDKKEIPIALSMLANSIGELEGCVDFLFTDLYPVLSPSELKTAEVVDAASPRDIRYHISQDVHSQRVRVTHIIESINKLRSQLEC